MAKTVSKETPLLEITLRKYEKPFSLSKRDLVKKLCLSLGLLQPGESRNIIVDILFIFLKYKRKREFTIHELQTSVMSARKQFKQPMFGVAESNIRRQVRRLRALYLIEKVGSRYRLTEFNSLEEIFDERIQGFILNTILNRIKDYLKEVDEQFSLK
jgi:hypothetical protein